MRTPLRVRAVRHQAVHKLRGADGVWAWSVDGGQHGPDRLLGRRCLLEGVLEPPAQPLHVLCNKGRSDEHTSELQSLMRISYAVFCLIKHKHFIISQHLLNTVWNLALDDHTLNIYT